MPVISHGVREVGIHTVQAQPDVYSKFSIEFDSPEQAENFQIPLDWKYDYFQREGTCLHFYVDACGKDRDGLIEKILGCFRGIKKTNRCWNIGPPVDLRNLTSSRVRQSRQAQARNLPASLIFYQQLSG